jgi:hypothetical protein
LTKVAAKLAPENFTTGPSAAAHASTKPIDAVALHYVEDAGGG